MDKSKKNPFGIFIYVFIEFVTLFALGLGTFSVLIFSGIFLAALHIRNFFIKRFVKNNKSV